VPAEEISIFPNPVTAGRVNILLKTPGQNTSIKVYELHGRMLQSTSVIINWQNNPLELDLSALPAGVYLVSVQTSDNFKTERIIKK
jgi:Secretion system C-terminal sorting domain